MQSSITEYKQTGENSGWLEERTNICYSNNFIVASNGQLLFDQTPTKKARKEIVAILRARGVKCWVYA